MTSRRSTLALTAVLIAAPAAAIVIRHDRDDARYRQLGQRYPQVCAMQLPGGEGTLVAPRWVVTAAHVARHLHQGRHVTCGGAEYAISRIEIYPEGKEGRDDIALVELAAPVAGVQPIELYRERAEKGATVTFVGRGRFGTGNTGPDRTGGTLRAATNVVDDAREQWLIFRFDEPPGGTDLEGISGPGDSGGPALLEVAGKPLLAGVSSGQDARAQGNREGVYGVTEYYVRVSSYLDWLDGILTAVPAAQ